ncbi:MAG TPA: GGDEF domain-containing protein [Myxococcota bacterium]|nr:GGDEF domain-containing protein [Myxococcota bacterium]
MAGRGLDAALRSLIGALDSGEVSRRALRAMLGLAGARAGEVALRMPDGSERVTARRGRAREDAAFWTVPLRAGGVVLGELRVRGERPRAAARRRELLALGAAASAALAAALTHEAVLRRADLDPLTGLANRGRLFEALAHELTRAERYGRALSLVMFDVDGLKRVNDRFGHPAGDQVLVDAGRLVTERSRASDTAARYGGDELVLVLPETPRAGALAVAEKIRASIEALRAGPAQVTVSAGVATAPEDGRVAAQLLAAADARLYAAKASGGNRVAAES